MHETGIAGNPPAVSCDLSVCLPQPAPVLQEKGEAMEKIKSIFVIFIIFLFTTMASFAILFRYSTTALKDSLMRVARMQMVYTSAQLNQKVREIEIEAEGILHSEDLKALHLTLMEAYDAWQYVTDANRMKDYLKSRQKSNVGMAEFILYWPASGRIISTLNI